MSLPTKNPEILVYVGKKPRNIGIRMYLDDQIFYSVVCSSCTIFQQLVLLLSLQLNLIRINSIFVGFGTILADVCVLFVSRKELSRKKNFGELLLQAVNSDDMIAVELVWQERTAKRKADDEIKRKRMRVTTCKCNG